MEAEKEAGGEESVVGCDYFIEGDEIVIEVVDYRTGLVVDELRIDRDEFDSDEMNLNVGGAKLR